MWLYDLVDYVVVEMSCLLFGWIQWLLLVDLLFWFGLVWCFVVGFGMSGGYGF